MPLLGSVNPKQKKRTKEFGLNIYTAQKQKSVWLILLEQFKSPIVYLLIFGAAVSFYFKDVIEGIFVWLAILICTGLMALVYILPQLRLVLDLTLLPTKVWVVSLLASLIPLVVVQIYKGK